MATSTIINLRVYVGSSISNCVAAYAAQATYDDTAQTVTLIDGVVLYSKYPLTPNSAYSLDSKSLSDIYACTYVGLNGSQQQFFDVNQT